MTSLPGDNGNEEVSDELNPENMQGAGVLDGLDVGEEKSDLDKIFEMMLAPTNIYHFTELNAAEITAFSTLGSMAKKYMPKGVVHGWLLTNLQMRVSKQRKGKTEAVKITSRLPAEQGPQRGGGWGNFFRGG
jgi:hypothetical protein